jgi:hypothetical protein
MLLSGLGRVWLKSVSRLRAELSQKSGHDFQNLFGGLLGEVLDGTTLSKKLGHFDREGIDGFRDQFRIGRDECCHPVQGLRAPGI